ncbi:DUF748 domain-containing protein [Flagellimonas amoyensis]|uniref:DUF748 domain-containing protein n=1 Tax=Flagellimonas amoyensis TaxID=2169401 RepID=UPI000D3CF237|nr:DUF748 domain-containing protein [Allomuricauda amoyensis]
MPKNNNTSNRRRILLGSIVLLLGIWGTAQLLFTKKVKQALKTEIPQEITLHYDKLSTNVLLGKIQLQGVSAKDSSSTLELAAKEVTLSGLGYLALLTKNKVAISELHLEEPVFNYQKKEKSPDSQKKRTDPSTPLEIDKFTITKGELKQFRKGSDSIQLHIEGIDFSLEDILMDGTATQELPFTHGAYELKTEQLYCDLGPFEFLRLQQIQLNADEGQIHQLELKSKYSQAELSKKLLVEHDHYDLTIDTLRLKQFSFGHSDGLPKFRLAQLQLEQPIFRVYRDKLVPDDTTHKKLYNQALRDLNMDLQVDSIGISDGTITYEERLEEKVDPESLRFTQIQATISNLHSRGSGMVTVSTTSRLMGDGFLTLDWSFDPQSKSNDFLATGNLVQFNSQKINPFLKTNLGAEVKGSIDEMYFTFSGNEVESKGDMKMAYDQFEFVVLKKDRLGVNKLLTTIVNIFAKKTSKEDGDGYRHGEFKVKRRTDKSFFNYLWLNVRNGLVDTMTGKDKKQKEKK